MWAAQGGHLAVVKFLVDRGVAVNARNAFGETALTWALQGLQLEGDKKRKGYEKMVAFLKEAGATE